MYKNKFDKYISKLNTELNQRGGQIVRIPHVLPPTQSWFFMPILLFPFGDMYIDFAVPDPAIGFNDILEGYFDAPVNVHRHNPEFQYTTNIQTMFERRVDGDLIVNGLIDWLKSEYTDRGVDIADRRTLVNALPGIAYDDADFAHLDGESQERLLESLGLLYIMSEIAIILVNRHGGREFTVNITG